MSFLSVFRGSFELWNRVVRELHLLWLLRQAPSIAEPASPVSLPAAATQASPTQIAVRWHVPVDDQSQVSVADAFLADIGCV